MPEELQRREDDTAVERDRTDERGDAAEPDAPATAEENDGMSTILSGDVGDGVQDDAVES
jgi:hypothetical protein